MDRQSLVGAFLIITLLSNAFCLPTTGIRIKRQDSSDSTNSDTTTKIDDNDINSYSDLSPPVSYNNDDNDDDDDFNTIQDTSNSSGGGGSNLFSLLNLVTAFLPGSSSSSRVLRIFFKHIAKGSKPKLDNIRRQDLSNKKVITDHIVGLKPPSFVPQEQVSNNIELENSESDSNESDNDNSTEETFENEKEKNESNEDTNLNTDEDFDNDDEYDEPPGGGDGEGGGLLGLLAGLSGGEDGQSDLGSLLATVSGIIANLSGDGIDLNALIASGIGLFVGLLSEGEQNPGEIIASYLLTSLDTITGGGSKNNGAFFGKFLAKLVKGTSALEDTDADSDEDGNKTEMKDSAGFFLSLLMGLLGDMSKGSSGSHPSERSFDQNKHFLTKWLGKNIYD